MVRRGAGRRNRVARALDLEPGAERRRGGRGHRFGHGERPDAFRALLAGDVGGFDDGARRRAARAHQDARAWIRDLLGGEPGVADRLLHGEMCPSGSAAMKTHRPTVDVGHAVVGGRALDLATEAELAELLRRGNPRSCLAQRRKRRLRRVADGGDDPHPGHDDAPHAVLRSRRRSARRTGRGALAPVYQAGTESDWNKPTFKSLASYMRSPSASNHPSAMPRVNFRRKTRFRSTP